MDKSQSETQPPGFLNWHVYVVESCTPCGIMCIASEGALWELTNIFQSFTSHKLFPSRVVTAPSLLT